VVYIHRHYLYTFSAACIIEPFFFSFWRLAPDGAVSACLL
jgi:hypothetical protein